MQVALTAMLAWYRVVLTRMGNPWNMHECEHRKIAFPWNMLSCQHTWLKVPRIVSVELPPRVRTVWLRLWAGNSYVPARHYEYIRAADAYRDRICPKCALGQVGDEAHVLLHCTATDIVWQRYHGVLSYWSAHVQSFVYNNRSKWEQLAEFADAALRTYHQRAG